MSLFQELRLAATRESLPQASRRSVLTLAAVTPAALGLDSVLGQVANERQRNGKQKRQNDKKKTRKKKDRCATCPSTPGQNPPGTGNGGQNTQGDIAVLNYALTLEHLEYAFYRDALFDPKNPDANPDGFRANDFNGFLDPKLYERLLDVKDHEDEHVDTLISVISSLGGTPVAEACYDFGYDTANAFLAVAQLLENTGVMAYTGALAGITSPDLQTAGATIATVEARHASYLNLINADNPFPAAFDEPKTMAQILAAASGFIVECPS